MVTVVVIVAQEKYVMTNFLNDHKYIFGLLNNVNKGEVGFSSSSDVYETKGQVKSRSPVKCSPQFYCYDFFRYRSTV